jgi:hypothetical protein
LRLDSALCQISPDDVSGGFDRRQSQGGGVLTDLAVAGKVAPSTQNQALNTFSRAPDLSGCTHPQTPRQARLDYWPSLA